MHFKKCLLVLSVLFLTYVSNAQQTANATAAATATIVAPITISKQADMNFGNISVTTGGTIVLSTGGTRAINGGVSASSAMGGQSAAAFTVAGEGDYAFNVTLPSSAVTLTRNSGSETMTIDAFTMNGTNPLNLSSGSYNLLVGATLHVAASQVAGTYTTGSSPFTVTVAYN